MRGAGTLIAAAILLSGCGSMRYTWIVNRGDSRTALTARQRYSIRKFLVSCCRDCQHDAMSGYAKGGQANADVPSREWVDLLYELYPNVFSSDGVPISISAEEKYDEGRLDDRSMTRRVVGKIGFVTLVPIIPAEMCLYYNWKIAISVGNCGAVDVAVDMKEEKIASASPLGLLCSYDNQANEEFQIVMDCQCACGPVLRKQIEAWGAGIAAELIAMENDGRIKVGAGVSSPLENASDDDPAMRARILSREHKKNLDSLLKSAVITEEESKKELGKETK